MPSSISKIAFFIFVSITLFGCNNAVDSVKQPSEPDKKAPKPLQAIGLNVNGQFNLMKFENLKRTKANWVRGFLDFFQLYPNEDNLESDSRIKKYLELKDRGYKTILNIKWDFSNNSFPNAGSEEMENYKSYLRKLLQKIWYSTDIIVVGNEPFIESKKSERDQSLVTFYKEVAQTIRNFREDKDSQIPIYIGAFNNMYLESWQTDATNSLIAFAEKEDWISGIDLHIHHHAIEHLTEAMDYVNPRIRENQKILITEYSLVKHWGFKMKEGIPEAFANEYDWDPKTQNYQYIDFALKNPVSRDEWVDFLKGSYWFENRKHYLRNAYQRFKNYDKFHIATYALRQSYPFNKDFTESTSPWILNGIFANRTVHENPGLGLEQFNYAWIDDFKKILQESSEN